MSWVCTFFHHSPGFAVSVLRRLLQPRMVAPLEVVRWNGYTVVSERFKIVKNLNVLSVLWNGFLFLEPPMLQLVIVVCRWCVGRMFLVGNSILSVSCGPEALGIASGAYSSGGDLVKFV